MLLEPDYETVEDRYKRLTEGGIAELPAAILVLARVIEMAGGTSMLLDSTGKINLRTESE